MKRLLTTLILSLALTATAKEIDGSESKVTNTTSWELGVGIGALNIADYLGSDEESAYVVPLPYFVYNSDLIKADRKGVRGLLWQYGDFELDISSKISLPVDSGENKARQGMPDLSPLFEIGPSINYKLFSSLDNVHNLNFQIPIRSAQEFKDWKLHDQGWVVNPAIEYNFQGDEWKIGFKLGAMLASSQYNQYYYDVKQEYTSDNRSFYEANKGNTAYKLTTTMSRRFKNWYFGAFIDYNDLHDSKNINSPLIKSKTNLNSGFFFGWVFKQKNN